VPLRADPPIITLDPPYRIPSDADDFVLIGWAQVADPAAPDITLTLNGIEFPVMLAEQPLVRHHFPGMTAKSVVAKVDFAWLFRALPAKALEDPFLLRATVTTDGYARTFEYAVTDAWLRRLSGRPLKALPVPPEHLQVRVAGAAAGGFHAAGRRTAAQIAGILAGAGALPAPHARILDFGAGPGRLIQPMHNLFPTARLSGSDIDAEAIGWAQRHLGHIADFRVNAPEPPLPFPDEAFDLIYSISIFTHLPEQMQWGLLSELRRILKPGGVLLTTKLDPAAYDLPADVKAQGVGSGFAFWGGAAATEGLPGFYRLAYHTKDYVAREWGRYFEVLHIGAHDLNDTQDAVLLRRPRHALSWLPSPVRKTLHRTRAAVMS
jgi:SAM-dependent methyltransferase